VYTDYLKHNRYMPASLLVHHLECTGIWHGASPTVHHYLLEKLKEPMYQSAATCWAPYMAETIIRLYEEAELNQQIVAAAAGCTHAGRLDLAMFRYTSSAPRCFAKQSQPAALDSL